MKIMTQVWVLSLLVSLPLVGVTAEQAEVFEAFQKAPWDPKVMQALQAFMRNEREPAPFRSRAMALCTLALLRQGNTNQFSRALNLMASSYADEKGLITVSIAQNMENCALCSGKGKRDTSCPACKGAACTRCNGTRKVQTLCSMCMGSGQQFKVSPAVNENAERLAREAIELCQENQRFEKQSALAFAEQDNEKRLKLLEGLLSEFPKRTDLDRVKKALDEARRIHDAALARKAEQEKREKEEAAVEQLRALRQVPAKEREKAIFEIEAFLSSHPKCFAKADLEELKAELTAKMNFRNRLVMTGYVLGSLCGLFVLVTFLKATFMSNRAERLRPLPGMDRIDKSKFTDPLSEERERTEARRRMGPPPTGQ